jgi:hypothetical protein
MKTEGYSRLPSVETEAYGKVKKDGLSAPQACLVYIAIVSAVHLD